MLAADLHSQAKFITDNNGKKLAVILPLKNYERILRKLDMLQDIMAYDKAKNEDDGSRIIFEDYLRKRRSDESK